MGIQSRRWLSLPQGKSVIGVGGFLDGIVNIIRAGTDLIYGLAQTAELGRLKGISPFKHTHTHTVMHFLVSDLIS